MNAGVEEIRETTGNFLLRWPSRKFSRSQSFREDLARTADTVSCKASQVKELTPPGGSTAFDQALDAVLEDYILSMEFGREAARTRNVSKYRDWLQAIDGFQAKLDQARESAGGG